MSMQGRDPYDIEYDHFTSDHYGIRVGRLSNRPLFDKNKFLLLLNSARRNGFQLIFTRIKSSESKQKIFWEKLGAKNFGELITLKRQFDGPSQNTHISKKASIEIRDAISSRADINEIMKISASSFSSTHLFADPRLPVKKTQKLYADWSENNIKGRSTKTIVARLNSRIVGFINMRQHENDEEFKGKRIGIIDLIAISEEFRKQGIGKSLLIHAIEWFSKNTEVATVGTDKNNPALLFYKSFNFKPYKKEIIYHMWLD